MFRFQKCLIIVALLVFLGTSIPAHGLQGAKLSMDETIFDAKAVVEGEVVEHTFRVLNQGDQVLEIQKVRPG